MRGVADQRQPLGGDPRRMMEAERVARPRRRSRQRAEEPAHPPLGLGEEAAVAELQHARRILRRHRPHDRRAVPRLVVGQRQQRERPRRVEDLERHAVVRPLVVKGADDRAMIVAPRRDGDAGSGAGRRVATFGGDQQRRAHRAAVVEPCRHARGLPLYRQRPRRHPQVDQRRVAGGVEQRPAQRLVLVHDAQRAVVLVGDEVERAPLQPVADPDLADRAAVTGQSGRRPPIASSILPLALATAEARPSNPGASVTAGSAGSTMTLASPCAASATPSVAPTSPPPRMMTSVSMRTL